MEQTNSVEESLSKQDAERVGNHVVIEQADVVPGKHPEPHLRSEGQTSYVESYLKCVDCGVEVLRKRDFPEPYESGVSR